MPTPFPSRSPHLFRPATLHIDFGNRFPDQGIDESRLAGADLAKNDNLHAASGDFFIHLLELIDIMFQTLPFRVGTTFQLRERRFYGSYSISILGIGHGDFSLQCSAINLQFSIQILTP